mmetsp:Transcript_25037/g.34560  ORF Transcript_25037/g.34560 Transcript_25037/m.34560 type:complete len:194 (-) Transcript_25037:240-821(-)|eukprot:CAMPEP_0201474820 /NCGR_PEP_ID=MMETSP0151_2-20130828/279_1 /ASSEMBLY_ACC=CAM_ASM_000257 /TAXON_ID=200890 /ORGANISM="Paramoeba atlantica, Strain 621/1 / CCAP 1560/9" /LENGTH=193 /DNA_ID=CAMNT_0047854725 /DNA_START=78 /DNA_END=659 /DNA_ORIENTATION=+
MLSFARNSFGRRSFHSSSPLLRNILVGVDGSGYSDKAFHEAILTMKEQDNLYLLTVPAIPYIPYNFLQDAGQLETTVKTILEQAKEEANHVLELYHQKALHSGISKEQVHTIISQKYGNTRSEILCEVEERDIDLLVLGSHGKGPLGKLILGSTSDYLIHEAPCDVLIVKLSDKEKEEYKRLGMLESHLDPLE